MLRKLLDALYFKIKRNEIKKARYRLRKINIEAILRLIIRNCEEKDIKNEILEKRHDYILVKLYGKKEKTLLKYHRTDMVFSEDYNEFLNKMKKEHDNEEAIRGVYITSGIFETQIHKNENKLFFRKKVILDDYTYFMKKQLGLRGKTVNVFKQRKLNFYKYLPRT